MKLKKKWKTIKKKNEIENKENKEEDEKKENDYKNIITSNKEKEIIKEKNDILMKMKLNGLNDEKIKYFNIEIFEWGITNINKNINDFIFYKIKDDKLKIAHFKILNEICKFFFFLI
jgi:hypothetical protein